jgi:hypothetical protein
VVGTLISAIYTTWCTSMHTNYRGKTYLLIFSAITLWVGFSAAAIAQCKTSSQSVTLGTTGLAATLVETNDGDSRTLIVTESDGKRHVVKLQDDHDGNNSTNLYYYRAEGFNGQIADSGYVLLSKKDCVEIANISHRVQLCDRGEIKRSTLTYMGRYDWMNGETNGKWQLGFRYSDFTGASEDQGVWQDDLQ